MSMVDRLVQQLSLRGLSIKPGNEPGTLILSGPGKEKTPEVIKALKMFKPQLMERLGLNAKPPEQKPENTDIFSNIHPPAKLRFLDDFLDEVPYCDNPKFWSWEGCDRWYSAKEKPIPENWK